MRGQLKRETRQIDGTEFVVEQHGAFDSHLLNAQLASLLGPAAIEAIVNGEGMDHHVPMMFARLSRDGMGELLLELFSRAQANLDGKLIALNKRGMIDEVFNGRMLTMYKVVGLVLEVNYKDFLDGVRAAFQAYAARKAAEVAAASST